MKSIFELIGILIAILWIFIGVAACFSLYYWVADSNPLVLAYYLDFEAPQSNGFYDILRWVFSVFHNTSDLFGILDKPMFIYKILTRLGGVLLVIGLIGRFAVSIFRESTES